MRGLCGILIGLQGPPCPAGRSHRELRGQPPDGAGSFAGFLPMSDPIR